MKGKIMKLEGKWIVISLCYNDKWSDVFELHPKDVERIEQDSQVFDNIEARIAANPEVEYELVLSELDGKPKYAKLLNIDKERQAELLREIMHADEDTGLYDKVEDKTFKRKMKWTKYDRSNFNKA